MAKRVQLIRHVTSAAQAFLGLEGEITVDLTSKALRVHDGVTPGGQEQANAALSNVPDASASNNGRMTPAQVSELTNATAGVSSNLASISIISATLLTKANKFVPSAANNVALLDAAGDLADSGTQISDLLNRANHTGQDDLTSDVTGVLPITNGGTGANTAAAARAALGAQAADSKLNDIVGLTPAKGKLLGTDATSIIQLAALTAYQIVFGDPSTASGFRTGQLNSWLGVALAGFDGVDGAKIVAANETPADRSYHYTTYTINGGQVVTPSDGKLIIFARDSVTISGKIDLRGLGAPGGISKTGSSLNGRDGSSGSFGGGGGGGGAANTTNVSGGDGGTLVAQAGALGGLTTSQSGANGVTQPIEIYRMYHDFLFEIFTNRNGGSGGGAGGIASLSGGDGGNGGGDLLIISPQITINASGEIDISGTDGTNGNSGFSGGSGGGGGGRFIALTKPGGFINNGTINVSGGLGSSPSAAGDGGDGGNGLSISLELL